MSFLSGLKVFGMDVEKAFAWAATPTGKAVISTGETVLETALPITVPIVALFNAWWNKAATVEGLAAAAGKATGTGAQKAVIVDQAIAPDVIQFVQQAGVSARTTGQIAEANNAVVAFINAMTQPAPPAPPAPATPAA